MHFRILFLLSSNSSPKHGQVEKESVRFYRADIPITRRPPPCKTGGECHFRRAKASGSSKQDINASHAFEVREKNRSLTGDDSFLIDMLLNKRWTDALLQNLRNSFPCWIDFGI